MKTFALILTTLLLAAGCGSGDSALQPPDGGSDYAGTVSDIDGGSVLVTAGGDRCGIWLRQGDSAQILAKTGSGYADASWDDLQLGAEVDLWIPGGIAESCPMQGTAGTVVITAPA